jgi:phage-related minor tail protein
LDSRTPSSPTSGTGANVVDINEILNKRREQIEQERVLIGLTGQRRKEEELYFEIMNQIAPEQKVAASDFVRGEAQKLVALQQTNDALQAQRDMQEQVSQLLESSMEKAFMSIVDGTSSVKDAFKAMASDIIKELYRVLVVQRLVGSAKAGTGIAGFISGLIGNANGNAFSNGNVVPFANGGVVGSPTTFPMAGGKTGLMGEAGPEAIMPLKRGKDGKLGVAADGGGTVVVNNHFNISANGDDSVKRIVRQQIPQIAEATKAAVVDAKRRGGSYGRAFG